MEKVQKGAKWTWSATLPGAIIGYSLVRGPELETCAIIELGRGVLILLLWPHTCAA